MPERSIGFVGAGNMAGGIIRGLASAGAMAGRKVMAWDPRGERLEELDREFGVEPAVSNATLCRQSDVVVLAVKPQLMDAVLAEVAGEVNERTLVISIAAGITLGRLGAGLPATKLLVRVMPNAPLLVGKGMSAFACAPEVPAGDRAFVRELFSAAGRVVEVDEKLMDAVTAVSGSGPAYVFAFIEGLADGAVKAGVSRDLAIELAAQTTLGAAEMVLATGQHPMKLKDLVTSPGGTTIEGLHVLEDAGFRGALMGAVEAALLRARELGRKDA